LSSIVENYQDARREEANAEAYPYSDLEGYKATAVGVGRRVPKKKHWPDLTSTPNNSDVSGTGDEDSDVETRRVEKTRKNTYLLFLFYLSIMYIFFIQGILYDLLIFKEVILGPILRKKG